MATNVYVGAELDIDIKYQSDISVAFTVLNSDASAYSFTNKTDSDFNVYEMMGGTLVKNWGENASEGLSYASNVVTLNAAWLSTLEANRNYYYEITYEDSGTTNPTIVICFGLLKIE